MRNTLFRRAIATVTPLALAGAFFWASPATAEDSVTINLVAINDFHGQIDHTTVQWAATVEQLLADGPAENALLISAGDNVGTSTEASSLQHDDPTIDVLNTVGLDVSAAGNHEFDRGYDDLVGRIMERADFPIIAANIHHDDGSPALEASTMFTVGGLRVAVIGATTETTPTLVPTSAVEGLTFTDPVAAVNDEVARLQALPADQRPDLMVAAIHEGAPWGTWTLAQAMEASAVFSRMVTDIDPAVDAIIAGHTHNIHTYDVLVPGDDSRTRPLIQTGHFGENVGQIKLTVDTDSGEVVAYSASNTARVTTSEQDLIASSDTLDQVAQIRDAAVAYIDEHAAAVQEAELAAQSAEGDFNAAVESSQAAQSDYDTAMTAATAAQSDYSDATAAAEAARQAYATAVEDAQVAKAEFDTAMSQATAARDAYTAAVDEANAARTDHATALAAVTAARDDYLAAAADAQAAQADYTKAVQDMEKAKAEYASAVEATLTDVATAAAADYQVAVDAAQNAVDRFNAAVVVGQEAKTAYDAAMKDAQAAVERFEAAVAASQQAAADYQRAMQEAQAAFDRYLEAASESQTAVKDHEAAVAAAQTAADEYAAAIEDAKAASERYSLAKVAIDLAVAAYEAAMNLLHDLLL